MRSSTRRRSSRLYGMAGGDPRDHAFVPHSTGMKSDVVDPKAMQAGEAKPLALDASPEAVAAPRRSSTAGGGLGAMSSQISRRRRHAPRRSPRQVGEHPDARAPVGHERLLPEEPPSPGRGRGWKARPDGEIWVCTTGDLGYIADGGLYIDCGRSKRHHHHLVDRQLDPTDIEWIVERALRRIRRRERGRLPGVDVEGEEQPRHLCAEAFQSVSAEGLTGSDQCK